MDWNQKILFGMVFYISFEMIFILDLSRIWKYIVLSLRGIVFWFGFEKWRFYPWGGWSLVSDMDKGRLAVAAFRLGCRCWGFVLGTSLRHWSFPLEYSPLRGCAHFGYFGQFLHSWGMQVRPDTDSVEIHYIILIPLLLLVQHERFCLGYYPVDQFWKEKVFV